MSVITNYDRTAITEHTLYVIAVRAQCLNSLIKITNLLSSDVLFQAQNASKPVFGAEIRW